MSDFNAMKLRLYKFDQEDVTGIYGWGKNVLAKRMLYLSPSAAYNFMEMNKEKEVRCSDMFRTPEASLLARKRKRGVQPPGWSGHNFGFCIDIDVQWMLKNHDFKNKVELDEWMQSYGWFCHVPLGVKRSFESWHYNFFGVNDHQELLSYRNIKKRATWSWPVAKKIDLYYGSCWEHNNSYNVQRALKSLSIYNGNVDGILGPLSTEAVEVFQRAWGLKDDGIAGIKTRRVLMLVTADKLITSARKAPCL